MKLGFKRKEKENKSINSRYGAVVFRHRGFWAQLGWLALLLVGCSFAAGYRSVVLFTLSLVCSFLGLNEFGRLKYKTNLVLCSVIALLGALAGVFNWLDTGSIFFMMCVTCGFVLYYRDTVRAMLPEMCEFADVLACCDTEAEVAWKTHVMLHKLLPDCRIFVLVADDKGGLFLPEHGQKRSQKLRREGGVVWKCFASTLPYRRETISVEKDLPLYREARSLIAAPIIACGETLGVVEIEARVPAFFSEDDKDRLCVLAFLTGQAIYVARAKQKEK